MLAHQDDTGAFRSRTYSAFKDGFSLTPLLLTSLRFAPPAPELERAYARGVDFLATLVTPSADDDADVALAYPSYPVYAIAGALLVLNVPKNARHRSVRDRLIGALRARQFTEDTGWAPADGSYGAWGYYPGIPHKRATADDPALSGNLSATLFAIGALRLAGVPVDDPTLAKARQFVERCQNYPVSTSDGSASEPGKRDADGGFYFSPALPDGNKAGPVSGVADRYRSYGSMTADGLRALIRLGLPIDHPRVRAATAWLHRRYSARRNPGDFPEDRVIRQESAYFYYAWSSAHALRAIGARQLTTDAGDLDWPVALADELLSRQRPDGSWANPYSEMREDDPLLATAFAMAGLTIARTVLREEYRSHSSQAPD